MISGVQCPIGRYGNTTGLTADVDCSLCDPGYHCPQTGLTLPYAECSAGHYCELGAEAPNPNGETWGYHCPDGHYCPQGTPIPVPCDRGTYQPLEQRATEGDCIECEPGYYCLYSGRANVTDQCDEGYYCTRGAEVSNPTGIRRLLNVLVKSINKLYFNNYITLAH